MDFEKFDKSVDLDGLKKDIEDAKENGLGDFKEVPVGTYEVKVEKMELTESKKGDPMVTIWFKILAGEYKNSMIFYNQVITQGFQIHLAKELINSMGGKEIEFESYSQFHHALMDVHESIDGVYEYAIKYGENSKGYKTYSIDEIFEVE